MGRIGDILKIYRLSTGSILFCLREINTLLAQGPDNPSLKARIDRALLANEEARKLDLDWKMGKKSIPMVRRGAAELDAQIDRTLSAIFQSVEVIANLIEESPQRHDAQELREALFEQGVNPVTALRYEDQHAAVGEILTRLRGPFANHVTLLHLEALVAQLETLHQRFGDALSVINDDGVTWDRVDAARQHGEDEFHRLLFQIYGDYVDDDERRAQLLRPVLDQNERAGRHWRRRRTAPDVDPETGLLIDDPAPGGGEPGSDLDDEPTVF